MRTALKVLLGFAIACVLIVGGCTAALWSLFAPEPGAGDRRDTVRAHYGALAQQLADTAQGAEDLAAAADRLRGVTLPPAVLGLAVTQRDSDENRIVLHRDYDGRQTRHVIINGAGTVTYIDRNGVERVFDVLQTRSTLANGDAIEIELVLSRAPTPAGPE